MDKVEVKPFSRFLSQFRLYFQKSSSKGVSTQASDETTVQSSVQYMCVYRQLLPSSSTSFS